MTSTKAYFALLLLCYLCVSVILARPRKANDKYKLKHPNGVVHMDQDIRDITWFGAYEPTSSNDFNELLEQYRSSYEQLHSSAGRDVVSLSIDWKCNSCKVLFFVLQDILAQEKSQDEVANIATKVCIDLKIEDERVCKGVIQMFKLEVLTVFGKLALSYEEACGYIIGDGCGEPYDPTAPWNVTLPKVPKPQPRPPVAPKAGLPKVSILHLSDIHLDLQYKPGSNGDCGEPVCCRANDGEIKGPPAGKWGDYRNCDTPKELFENMFQDVKKRQKFDMIYWTGDLPGHYVWNQTEAGGVGLQDYVTRMFLEYFPGIPVYSAVGNHEGVPVNSFPLPFVKESSTDWLYTALAKNWSHWLPEATKKTVKYGGYFSVLFKPGFRIISLNTNYCNNQNWWILLNGTDPVQELQWLIAELQRAEDNNEKVHLIGHIPPGHPSCLKTWSWNLHTIIERYENTISAQFYGHTHFDEFEIFYDEQTRTRPTSVAFIGPSVTPYTDLNPGYRIYQVDGAYPDSSWGVLDHTNYVMNITEANQTDNPVWKLEYTASDVYNLKTFFPEDCHKLYSNLKANNTLLQTFYRYKYKLHPPSPSCDAACNKKLLCEIRTSRSHDPDQCSDLMSRDEYLRASTWARLNSYC